MSKLTLVEDSDLLILPIEKIKKYARITSDDEDELIFDIFFAAQSFAENMIRFQFSDKTYEYRIEIHSNKIFIPFFKKCEIISVKVNNLEIGNYLFEQKTKTISLQSSEHSGICEVIFKTFADPYEITKDLQSAILDHFVFLYDNRGAVDSVPKRIINCYKAYRNLCI